MFFELYAQLSSLLLVAQFFMRALESDFGNKLPTSWFTEDVLP